MAKKLSDAQRKVLNDIGAFGLQGGYYTGKTAQVIILEDLKLIEPRGVSKFAVTLTGCEFVGINYTDAIDEIHECALLENAERTIVEASPAEQSADETTEETAQQTIERYSGHVYFEDRVTPKEVEQIIVARLVKAMDRAASGVAERWLIQQNIVDFILPQITNRDAEISELKARIVQLEEQLKKVAEEAEGEYADWLYEDAALTRAHYLTKAKNLRS